MRNIQNTAPSLAVLLSTSCALFLFGAAAAWATPHYKPGEWKYKWKVHVKVMGLTMPSIPVTVTSCVKGEHPFLNDPKMKKGNCKMVDPKTEGNKFSYTASCGGNGTVVDTHYKLTFHGDRVDGTFTQTRTTNGKVAGHANGTVEGKRIGSCTKNK
jgi:hypothetical protein